MSFEIIYHPHVVRADIPKLSTTNRRRIQTAIEEKLIQAPEVFGKPLRRSVRGYRALRVGSHRVIFRIEKETVKIFLIAHRSIVYDIIKKRV